MILRRFLVFFISSLFLINSSVYADKSSIYAQGTGWVPPAGDADGTQYISERYPDAYQTSGLTVMATVTIGNKAIVNSIPYLSSSIQAWKWARINVTFSSAAAEPWH